MSDPESTGQNGNAAVPANSGSARRRIIIVLLLLIIGAAGAHWGGDLWRQAKLLRAQRQCLQFTAPADQVLYDVDLDQIAKYMASDQLPDISMPPGWKQLLPLVQGNRYLSSENLANDSVDRRQAIVFLHELTSSAGKRLVCVRYAAILRPAGNGSMIYHQFQPLVIQKAGWRSAPVLLNKGIHQSFQAGTLEQNERLRAFNGQPDAKDRSRFALKFQVGGNDLIIDGRLQGDDNVILVLRRFKVPTSSAK